MKSILTCILVISVITIGITITILESREDEETVHASINQSVESPMNVDVNGDGKIDILDLVLVGRHFGESVQSPDIEPLKIVSSFPKDGAKDIHPDQLSRDGMEIKFNKPVMNATVDVMTFEGRTFRWTVEISKDTPNVVMLKGYGLSYQQDLPFETEIILIVNAEDFAGNKLEEAKIFFTTLSMEDWIPPLFTSPKLVGYWQFDDGKGDWAIDISVNENDAKINGAIWVDGMYGKALKFDGVDDIVEIPDSNSLDITQSITVTAWFSPKSPEGGLIIGKEGAYGLSLGDGLNIKWIIPGNEWETGINIPQDKWSYVALVYDFVAQKRLVYLNDKIIAEKETVIPIPVSDKPLIIGKGFNGIIDEVSIWKKSLNEEEIQECKIH